MLAFPICLGTGGAVLLNWFNAGLERLFNVLGVFPLESAREFGKEVLLFCGGAGPSFEVRNCELIRPHEVDELGLLRTVGLLRAAILSCR